MYSASITALNCAGSNFDGLTCTCPMSVPSHAGHSKCEISARAFLASPIAFVSESSCSLSRFGLPEAETSMPSLEGCSTRSSPCSDFSKRCTRLSEAEAVPSDSEERALLQSPRAPGSGLKWTWRGPGRDLYESGAMESWSTLRMPGRRVGTVRLLVHHGEGIKGHLSLNRYFLALVR